METLKTIFGQWSSVKGLAALIAGAAGVSPVLIQAGIGVGDIVVQAMTNPAGVAVVAGAGAVVAAKGVKDIVTDEKGQ